MTRLLHLAAVLTALVLGTHASAAPARRAPVRATPASETNFGRMVTLHDGGHIYGNPEAETKLVEYMSYTCSHCYEFSRTGEAVIRLALVPQGKVSYEIRHSLRDIVDLTAAMLTTCGDVDNFPLNHEAMLSHQPEWIERARKATQAQMTRWNNGTLGTRLRAIASDLGFYDLMEPRGYNRVQLDRCLTDEARATALAETSQRDNAAMAIQGTPSFAINGKLLDGVYSWDALKPYLEKLD